MPPRRRPLHGRLSMCVGIPMQVVHEEGARALCRDRRGEQSWVDLLLTGPQPAGTWLMTFLGAARAVIDEAEAARTNAALDALDSLLAGEAPDLDAAFADLVAGEPRLPDFLRPRHAAALPTDPAGEDL